MAILREFEVHDQAALTTVYELISEYVTYGEWKNPNQFDHIFQRIMGLLPRPRFPMTLYRVLRLTDEQRSMYEAGWLTLKNRKFSSWTTDINVANKLAQIKGNNCLVISEQFGPSHIVIDVQEFYQDNDFDNSDFTEYDRYVRREHEVIVFDSGEREFDHFNSHLFTNEPVEREPHIGDRVFAHDEDEDGSIIRGVADEQPYANRGLFSVTVDGRTRNVRSLGDYQGAHDWEIVGSEIYEEAEPESEHDLYADPIRAKAFTELAKGQRGDPEMAMLRVQHANIGGVVNYVVEHVGDLTHRMAQYPEKKDYFCGFELVEPKVRRAIRMLDSGYGFAREAEQNNKNNAQYTEMPLDKFEARLTKALLHYANEHAKLRVYNAAQWHARAAAICLGHKDWKGSLAHLRALAVHLGDRDDWNAFASPFDPNFDKDYHPIV